VLACAPKQRHSSTIPQRHHSSSDARLEHDLDRVAHYAVDGRAEDAEVLWLLCELLEAAVCVATVQALDVLGADVVLHAGHA
jgi:hypothetical protein